MAVSRLARTLASPRVLHRAARVGRTGHKCRIALVAIAVVGACLMAAGSATASPSAGYNPLGFDIACSATGTYDTTGGSPNFWQAKATDWPLCERVEWLDDWMAGVTDTFGTTPPDGGLIAIIEGIREGIFWLIGVLLGICSFYVVRDSFRRS